MRITQQKKSSANEIMFRILQVLKLYNFLAMAFNSHTDDNTSYVQKSVLYELSIITKRNVSMCIYKS